MTRKDELKTPPQGSEIDVCDARGNEFVCISLGWRGAGGRLIVRGIDNDNTQLACEWKYRFEGTSCWRP